MSKQHISLREFCEYFYERHIFGTDRIKPELDHVELAHSTLKDSLIEADQSFSEVDGDLFNNALILLRIEAFACAWLDKFGLDSALEQSRFTANYLVETKRAGVWEDGELFNKAVAESVTYGKTADTPLGRFTIGSITHLRFNTAKEIIDGYGGIDKINNEENKVVLESMGRVINRLKTKKLWEKMKTPYILTLAFSKYVGHDLNEESQARIAEFIKGFYDGSYELIDKIKLQ